MSAGLFTWLATVVFITYVFLDGAFAQQPGGADDGNQCTSQKSCRQCLVADPSCAWCYQENFLHPHCNVAATLRQLGCEGNIIEPSSSIHLHKDISLTQTESKAKSKSRKSGPTVQLKPQKVLLKTRIGEKITLEVKFRQAEDYPVDLYYLMDLTYSMQDHKEKLYELGESLVQTMENMTKNFRLGFGSFVDKALMPYVDSNPNKVSNPCPDNLACVAPYGFRNHMSLSNDTYNFKNEVKKANISGNLDDAEGGFDALMQVIVCQEKIKWKEEVRKIVLFATDSGFHYAGDGKLGGVVKPNDELCHLDDSGYYTESKEQDYPSLSQINRQMLAHKVNLLFVVPEAVSEQYSQLSRAIDGALMGTLSDDNSNIVTLINEQYKKIRSSVILIDDAPKFVKVTYHTKCQGRKVMETNQCDNMTVGKTVEFNVSVTVLRCPEKVEDRKFTFHVSPVGLSDTLEVKMELFCECDCGRPEEQEVSSPRCNGSGTFECGVCLCDDRYFGRFCECSVDKDSTDVTHVQQASCLPANSTSSELCSGNGECKCGECHCGSTTDGDMYYGPYCECNDFTCRSSGGLFCGGRGKCVCNKCVCSAGWSGEDCGCQTSTDNCINPKSNNKALCSGEGECKCNSCQCTKTKDGQFGGLYCEECPTCTGQCEDLRNCIECEFQRRMPKAPNMECPMCNRDMERTFYSNQSDVAKENYRNCTFLDDQYCKYQFSYSFTADRKIVVSIYEHKECPTQIQVGFVALAVIGGVVLIGVAIIIIMRLCMFLKDRRDYTKFLEQIKNTNWGTEENPLYKKAMTMYRNPTYGKTD